MTTSDLGEVRYCRSCKEWYPEDTEFWDIVRRQGKTYQGGDGGTYVARSDHLNCKACHRSRSAISTIRRRNRNLIRRCACGIRTSKRQCHGCAGRTVGPLTVAMLERAGLVPRSEAAA